MESELWSSMNELVYTTLPIIAVDEDGNYKYYEEVDREVTDELINDGYIKWCYLADLVQAAYEL